MKSKKFVIIEIVIVLFLFSIMITSSNLSEQMDYDFGETNQIPNEIFDKLKQSSQWTLPNIYITNWSIANMTYDWCNYKNGHYIIENVSITGVSGKNGIHIENTTENFIIRNCQVNEGIQLLRTDSGELVNNTIYFGYSFYSGLSDQIGISLNNCCNINIRDNHLNDTYDESYLEIHGFLIYNCINITIEKNTLSIFGGSILPDSRGLNVQKAQEYNDIEIVNNTIYRFDIGIIINSDTTECNLTENQLYNSRIGLVVRGTNHIISNNIIKNSTQWSLLLGGSNNTLFGNKISETGVGIRTSNAENNVIESNSIQDVSDDGMHMVDSHHNNITNNIIQNVGEVGLYLDTCNYTNINGNYISFYLLCIVEIDCYGNIINNNVCIHIPSIAGYYPLLLIGILLMTTVLIIKFKLKKYK